MPNLGWLILIIILIVSFIFFGAVQVVSFVERKYTGTSSVQSSFITIGDVMYLHYCKPIDTDNCARVKSFTIAENNTFNCEQRVNYLFFTI